jgi:hypothetical protein
MLPIIVQHLPRDRERMGLRPVQMAGRLSLTLTDYRALEAGELHITNDLYEPSSCAGGLGRQSSGPPNPSDSSRLEFPLRPARVEGGAMRITVTSGGGSGHVSMSDGIVEFDGSLPPKDEKAIRDRVNKLAAGQAEGTVTVHYRTDESPAGQSSVTPGDDRWLALVALIELPEMGYQVGISTGPLG